MNTRNKRTDAGTKSGGKYGNAAATRVASAARRGNKSLPRSGRGGKASPLTSRKQGGPMGVSKALRSDTKIRYAVVGLGELAQRAVLPAFQHAPNSELVSIVSGDAEKLKKVGKQYKLSRTYSYEDYDKALNEVDAVYLVLPNHLHREYAEKAAAAGVHVLCEKPMAVTEVDCESMIVAAATADVKLMIAYRLHFEKSNLEAIRIASEAKLGKLRIFESEFTQQVAADNVRITEPVDEGGGPVYDLGIYCINAARYLFRAEPSEVFAMSANGGESRFQKAGEMTSVLMRFPQERVATFTCSFGSAEMSRYTLIGTKGILTASPAYDYSMPLEHTLKVGKRTTKRTFPKRDQFAAELIYFSNCILNGADPEPSGLEGLADVRIIRAIYESARTGKTVGLADLPAKKRPSMVQEIHRPPVAKTKTVNTRPAKRQ